MDTPTWKVNLVSKTRVMERDLATKYYSMPIAELKREMERLYQSCPWSLAFRTVQRVYARRI